MPADYPPEIVKEGQVTIVALGPEYENLDEPRLDALTDVLLQVAETASPPIVVLDLSHTLFLGLLLSRSFSGPGIVSTTARVANSAFAVSVNIVRKYLKSLILISFGKHLRPEKKLLPL